MRAVVFRKNPGKCVISPLMEHREKAILLIPLAPSLFFFFWGFFPHFFHPVLFMSPFHYCPPPPSLSFFYFFIWVSVTEFWIGPLWLWITACPFKLFRNQSLLHVFFKLCIRKFFLYIKELFPKKWNPKMRITFGPSEKFCTVRPLHGQWRVTEPLHYQTHRWSKRWK